MHGTTLVLLVYICLYYLKTSVLSIPVKNNITDPKAATNSNANSTKVDAEVYIDYEHVDLFKTQLCLALNISMSDCTCQIIPQLCAISQKLSSLKNSLTPINKTYTRSNEATILYVSVSLVASVIGLLGNTAVIITAYQNRARLPPCKVHIAQLAVVNFVFSILQIINIIPLCWTNTWPYGAFMCRFMRSLLEVSSFLSIGYIAIIAIGRYYLVVAPITCNRKSKKWRHIFVVLNMFIVIATIIPYSLSLGIENYSGRCIVYQNDRKTLPLIYNCSILLLYSIIPIILLFLLAVRMLTKLSNRDNKNLTCDKTIQTRINTRNTRVMYITLSIFLFFIVCTLPTRIITIYIELIGYQTMNVDSYVVLTLISYFTYPLQNILNPILYSMTAKTWRRQVKTSFASLTFNITL